MKKLFKANGDPDYGKESDREEGLFFLIGFVVMALWIVAGYAIHLLLK